MVKVRIVLNRSNVRQLLRSQAMMNQCTKLAYQAQARLGSDYEVTYMVGTNRVNASVCRSGISEKEVDKEESRIRSAMG